MATCNISTLADSAKDFAHLSENEREAVKCQLLSEILLELNPAADVTVATLLGDGKDFAHLSLPQQKTAELQLLCNILTAVS